MATDRITEIRVQGLRTLANVRLRLDGLTVLIGENGTGKSSLLEACELLHKCTRTTFYDELHKVHGGLAALMRAGARELRLGVRLEGEEPPLDYEVALAQEGAGAVTRIVEESLHVHVPGHAEPLRAIRRDRSRSEVFDQTKAKLVDADAGPQNLLLPSFGIRPPQRAIERAVKCLEQIDVHLPFDVLAYWGTKVLGRPSPLRTSAVVEPADRLARFGINLANAYAALKNDFTEAHWQETMGLVRLGLGPDVERVNVRADPGGGAIALRLELRGVERQVPAVSLSDGTLAYLAFVALYRLSNDRTLVAFDEPENHLEPKLLMRVLDFFENLAVKRAVVLATHSDRLLDGLSDPAASVVLCELDEGWATHLVRPDRAKLDSWLESYRGIGDVRAAGHEASVMTRVEKGVPE